MGAVGELARNLLVLEGWRIASSHARAQGGRLKVPSLACMHSQSNNVSTVLQSLPCVRSLAHRLTRVFIDRTVEHLCGFRFHLRLAPLQLAKASALCGINIAACMFASALFIIN